MLITKINEILDFILSKDEKLYNHLERTSLFTFALSKALNLNPKEKELAYFAGLLHDVGKAFSANDLQEHYVVGSKILKFINGLENLSEIILNQHEKWNGEGPKKLKLEDIPLISRIISIASSYDELHNIEGLSHEDAIFKIRSLSGVVFDPNMVEPFISIIESENLIEN